MKITAIFLFVGFATLLVVASCNRTAKTKLDDSTKRFALSEEISLGLEEEATTDSGKLTIKPLSAKDSRCPKGVNCIRAGEVFVEFLLKTANKEEKVKMATPPTGKAGGMDKMVFDGYTIRLLNVLPYPEQPKPKEVTPTTVDIVVERAR